MDEPVDPIRTFRHRSAPPPSPEAPLASQILRKRRVFLAKASDPPPAEPCVAPAQLPPDETPEDELSPPRHSPAEEDDLPVLTEIVADEPPSQPPPDCTLDAAQLSLLATLITQNVEARLQRDLPGIVETALREAERCLRDEIAASLESALQDALSRYK